VKGIVGEQVRKERLESTESGPRLAERLKSAKSGSKRAKSGPKRAKSGSNRVTSAPKRAKSGAFWRIVANSASWQTSLATSVFSLTRVALFARPSPH